ncbi:unnamed protein product [Caenorhabditis bovis]|uniref:Insulin-like domain-containing protein n=1 Tax=Caenorhabditis bovis TaxID=2654633 RepID=A0A8S1FFD0_9PELO|nr:unnamed protein product [Caenorhabditis bovis]
MKFLLILLAVVVVVAGTQQDRAERRCGTELYNVLKKICVHGIQPTQMKASDMCCLNRCTYKSLYEVFCKKEPKTILNM